MADSRSLSVGRDENQSSGRLPSCPFPLGPAHARCPLILESIVHPSYYTSTSFFYLVILVAAARVDQRPAERRARRLAIYVDTERRSAAYGRLPFAVLVRVGPAYIADTRPNRLAGLC
jgi:hypothetical protein